MSSFRMPGVSALSNLRALLTAGLGAAVLLSAISGAAFAQTPPSQPSETAAPPKPAEGPGLLGEIGKLLSAPAALLPKLKPDDPTPAPESEPAAAPAESAANPQPGSRLLPGIVSGRELCPRSDNGAPDCKIGSDRLCRSKGYAEGKSLNTDSVFGCSAKLQVRGKPCGTENYVTRAFCQ